MERTKDLHPNAGINTKNHETFNLYLRSLVSKRFQAQTAYKDSLQTDTVKNSKTPAAQINEKYHQNQVQEKTGKPVPKEHRHYRCPTCGRG